MKYYELVDKIKEHHEAGYYEINANRNVIVDEIFNQKFSILDVLIPTYSIGRRVLKKYVKARKSNVSQVIKNNKRSDRDYSSPKKLIFSHRHLDRGYNIIDDAPEYFYGLFDNFSNKSHALKSILESRGGSELIILEKETISSKQHYGGRFGKFSTGLFCEHPKDRNLLIPLENCNDLIKTMILEETLNAFQLLGAKSVCIEDWVKLEATLGMDAPTPKGPVKGGANISFRKDVLRKKEYGIGVFNPEKCFDNLKFLPDFPNLMGVIDGRIHGNQTLEEFSETINLSANLDLNVLSLFKAQAGFNYLRNWHFKVEFYDKNLLYIKSIFKLHKQLLSSGKYNIYGKASAKNKRLHSGGDKGPDQKR